MKGHISMILLTKLNHQKILINLETVKYIEAVPDTLIFFTNGESMMVLEDLETVAKAVLAYQTSIFQKSLAAQTAAL
jgi:uncharacterized protein YlzI (FlbEa/FlbD family)